MHTGKCRLLQQGKEIGQGDYELDSMTTDARKGKVEVEAPYGTRIAGGYDPHDDDVLVLEITGKRPERLTLADVAGIGYFDKSKQDIDYHRGWHGKARTVITVRFRQAVKQKNWRPVLLKAGVP